MGTVEADTERYHSELDARIWRQQEAQERIEFLLDDLVEITEWIQQDPDILGALVSKVARGNITEARDILEEVAESMAMAELERGI